MDVNQRKELLSKSYVGAIAAQLGLRSAFPDVDDDSVDLILKGRGFKAAIRNPQIEVQLKCTSINSGCNEYLTFPLPIKNYNDLRGDGNLLCPRFLFVLLVPENEDEWLSHNVNYMKVMHSCYWFSLSSLEDTANNTSVTVKIPRENLLTKHSLLEIMNVAASGIKYHG